MAADEAVASKAAAEADGIKKDTDSPFVSVLCSHVSRTQNSVR